MTDTVKKIELTIDELRTKAIDTVFSSSTIDKISKNSTDESLRASLQLIGMMFMNELEKTILVGAND